MDVNRLLGTLLGGGLIGKPSRAAYGKPVRRRHAKRPGSLVSIQIGGTRTSTARAVGALARIATEVLKGTLGAPGTPGTGKRGLPGSLPAPMPAPLPGPVPMPVPVPRPAQRGKTPATARPRPAAPPPRAPDSPPPTPQHAPPRPAGSVPASGPAPGAPAGSPWGTAGPAPTAAPGAGWSLPGREVEPAAIAVDPEDAEALLMVRAMIAAARADGTIDAEERARLASQLDDAGLEAEARALVLADFERPLAIEAIAAQVGDPMLAAQLYAACVVGVGAPSAPERAWLDRLAAALRLAPGVAAAIEARLAPPG